MNKGWSIRGYNEGDEDEIFELTKAMWGKEVPEKVRWMNGWKWIHISFVSGLYPDLSSIIGVGGRENDH